MSRIAYVNGLYQPLSHAVVHIEDRGFQFGDGIYEVWAILDGRLADFDGHMARLGRSLHELRIDAPMGERALKHIVREVVRRNRVRHGLAYLQITRGTARRDHPFPAEGTPPTLVVTAKSLNAAAQSAAAERGVAVVTQPDIRWGRCDIKTVNLLPNVLAKQNARERGAFEVFMVDELGLVTEGGSSNAWIVDKDGRLRTRDIQANILRGITREAILTLAREHDLEIDERPFSVDEVKAAREAFITSASAFVTPVVSIDGQKVGDGKPGEVAQRLRQLYLESARQSAI